MYARAELLIFVSFVLLSNLSFALASCASAPWTTLTSCADVRDFCNGTIRCAQIGSTYGTFACTSPQCSGIYCTTLPCVRDMNCLSILVPPNLGQLCERIAKHCEDNGYGELTQANADSVKGGSYSCLRCTTASSVLASPQPTYNETDITDNPVLVGSTFGVFITFAIVVGATSFVAKKYLLKLEDAQGEFQPRKCSCGFLASLLGVMDEQGNAVSWQYYYRNKHDLLKSCCGDQTRMWRFAEARVTIGTFALSFGLSLLFAGLKASEIAITDRCNFEGRAGGPSYTAALSQSSNYNLDAVDMDMQATLIVIANMMLINTGSNQFTDLLFSMKPGCLRFMLSLGIELTWGCVLLVCIVIEKNSSGVTTISGKYLLYFAAAILALLADWITSFIKMYIMWKLGTTLISCCGNGAQQPRAYVALN